MIKNALVRLTYLVPFQVFLFAYYLWYWLPAVMRANRAATAANLPSWTELDLQTVKTSDTVFILGSGPSINDITAAEWKFIKSHNSIGFNFFCVHEHLPTIYGFEAMDHSIDEWVNELVQKHACIANERPNYADIPILLSDFAPGRRKHWDALPRNWRDACFHVQTIPVFARNKPELRKAIGFLRFFGVFSALKERPPKYLFKYRASVSMYFSLAIMMGYKRIVFCGFDMNRPGYFYQNGEYPEFTETQSSRDYPGVHATAAIRPLMMPINDVIQQLHDQVSASRGIEVYVDRETSGFFPCFPVHPDFGQSDKTNCDHTQS